MDLRNNYLTAPMQGLEDLLLASSRFVSSTGLASIEEVRKQRVHWGLMETDPFRAKAERPLAILIDTVGTGWSPQTESDAEALYAGGVVELYLAATTSQPSDHETSYKIFGEWAGSVIEEMRNANGQGNHAYFNGITHATPIVRSAAKDRSSYDYFFLMVECTFGEDGR